MRRCVDLCAEEVAEARRGRSPSRPGGSLPKPREIRAFLDTYVVGQDRAERSLAVAVYNHYKRVRGGTPAAVAVAVDAAGFTRRRAPRPRSRRGGS
ncbi:hypothetical protein [Actinacidiphila sp. ITFR-21]|uniref:hypothetical protein n=1 Tax=Actinacidiphila sp. ITFR-21 TaxID=3075199 RepID=UPI00288B4881|nr:hypothetical protein [Streptomyces sp. ITFR-21]WNI16168.1 hypothetical protein RLT57_11910 [Streptomyces sp. ITFR-21]